MQPEDPDARGGWGGKLDFLLTCVGYAVGLGNIWRFPYLCYKSGGGAFFIPYTFFLLLCGIPLFFLEVTYGQFSSLSALAAWRVIPLFKGVGLGMLVCSAVICIYYNVIIAWTMYYLFLSFRSVLPWATCDNPWNTERCVDYQPKDTSNGTMGNGTVGNLTDIIGFGNLTDNAKGLSYSTIANATANATTAILAKNKTVSSSEEFWERYVLQLSDGIDNPGEMRWQLLICLIIAWVVVFFCLFKGVKVLGKVMHFAAPFPYLVLLILLIRGVTLPGAAEGIKFYIIPQWEKLADFNVWGDAALQIFYSVGMAWGGIITMASYNKFDNNMYRDALLVPCINCGTSVFAGFVIFSVLGFMAHEVNSTVEDIVTQGPGLVFVAYPEAITKLPISPLWAVLFFLMFFTIGLDSQFGIFETVLSGFMDEFPHQLRNKKFHITAVACLVEFLLGLPMITQGGIYVLQIMDWYCASFSLMIISLIECLALSWIYGTDRLYKDIALMIGYEPPIIWKYMWKFVTPFIITFTWLFSIATMESVTYGDNYKYPGWAIMIGWFTALVSIIPIPGVAIYKIMKTPGTILERIKFLMKPDPKWGPAQPEDRKRYLAQIGIAELDSVSVSTEKIAPPMANGTGDECTVAFLDQS